MASDASRATKNASRIVAATDDQARMASHASLLPAGSGVAFDGFIFFQSTRDGTQADPAKCLLEDSPRVASTLAEGGFPAYPCDIATWTRCRPFLVEGGMTR